MSRTELHLSNSDLEEIVGLGHTLLDLSRKVHDDLGEEGALPSGELNQYGEAQLVVDRDIEATLRAYVQDSPYSGHNWLVRSEEFSPIVIHPRRPIEGVIVIDGADGSSAAKRYLHGDTSPIASRYATMVAIAPGDNPLYGDFVFGGVNEHALQRKTCAASGQGAYMETPEGLYVPIHAAAPVETLTPETPVYAFDTPLFKRFNTDPTVLAELKRRGIPRSRLLSSASHWVDLASGATSMLDEHGEIIPKQAAAVIETSRKGQEEWPVAAIFAEESGFTLAAGLRGGGTANLSDLSFLNWQQQPIERRTIRGRVIVGSPSPKIAHEFAAMRLRSR